MGESRPSDVWTRETARNPFVMSQKWLLASMEGTSSVRRVRASFVLRKVKSGKGAVQAAVQAAVHSARPLVAGDAGYETRLCTKLLEASMLPCDRDDISSGRKSICSWFDLILFGFGNNILFAVCYSFGAVWTAVTT